MRGRGSVRVPIRRPLIITQPGAHYLPLVQFGNWLRVAGKVSGGPKNGSPAFVFDFYWVLKG